MFFRKVSKVFDPRSSLHLGLHILSLEGPLSAGTFARRLPSTVSPDVNQGRSGILYCYQPCSKNSIPCGLHKNYTRAGTLSVKRCAKTFCNPSMIAIRVKPQQLYLPSWTRRTENSGKEWSNVSNFTGSQDTHPIIIPFLLTPSLHSSSGTGNARLLVSSRTTRIKRSVIQLKDINSNTSNYF